MPIFFIGLFSSQCLSHSSHPNLRVVKSPYPVQQFPEVPYFDFIFSKLAKHGHRIALVSIRSVFIRL